MLTKMYYNTAIAAIKTCSQRCIITQPSLPSKHAHKDVL